MTKLRVLTVPPEYLPPQDQAEGYAVILGDCILPGHYLGRYADADVADHACRKFAEHYGLIAYPLENGPGHRPFLRLIQGGVPSEGDPR